LFQTIQRHAVDLVCGFHSEDVNIDDISFFVLSIYKSQVSRRGLAFKVNLKGGFAHDSGQGQAEVVEV
jgi:hypothetical protein